MHGHFILCGPGIGGVTGVTQECVNEILRGVRTTVNVRFIECAVFSFDLKNKLKLHSKYSIISFQEKNF